MSKKDKNYSDKALLSQRLLLFIRKMCLLHEHASPCWYHIQHIENSDRNLSSYFCLDQSTYNDTLIHAGLGKKRKGYSNVTISLDEWKKFQTLYLPAHYEVTEHADSKRSPMQNLKWIKLGYKPNEDKDFFSPTK